jgi:hypothetical protein
MPFRGDVSPGFDEALPRLSDEVARSALGIWLSLCDDLFRPAYEYGNVWSHPFEAEDRWHCLLVGIGERGSVLYLVALRVVVGCERAPTVDIVEAQDAWRLWRPTAW